MGKIFFKRFLRYCKENIVLFLALLILVSAVVSVVISLEGTAYTIIQGRNENQASEAIEDGQFTVLEKVDVAKIEDDFDVDIEEHFSVDVRQGHVTYRVFGERKTIDKLTLCEGEMASADNEIVLDQLYAHDNNIEIGDKIRLAGEKFKVTGLGSIPDYGHPTRTQNDVGVTTESFTWAMVSEARFNDVMNLEISGMAYTYAYKAGENTNASKLKGYLAEKETTIMEQSISNLVSFITREDNRRMDRELDYANLYKNAGFLVGALLIAMLAFIFAIVTKNQVHNEHCQIGALYALGISRNIIMIFYILPTLIVTAAGGAIGMMIGNLPAMVDLSMSAFHKVNSFPYYEMATPLMVYLYALAMPPVVSLAVNYGFLRRTLSLPALSLIRGTYEKIREVRLKIKPRRFIAQFQMHRFLEEKSVVITVISVFFSITLFMMGLNTHYLAINNEEMASQNIQYENLVTLRYAPADLETDGEKAYIEGVKGSIYGQDVAFSLIGLKENSSFYDVDTEKGVVAGKALATKLNLEEGDEFTFTHGIDNEEYTVTISDIQETGGSLELYMDISSMREMFDQNKDKYNSVFFKGEPDIDDLYVYSTTTKKSILDSFGIMEETMEAFINLAYVSSILIFISTMFLIVSTMIDRSTMGISLLRVFGYENMEVKRMYLGPLVMAVAIGLVAAIPLARLACNLFCPYVYIDLPMGMFFDVPAKDYVIIFALCLAIFFLILMALVEKVNGISTNEILKTRE